MIVVAHAGDDNHAEAQEVFITSDGIAYERKILTAASGMFSRNEGPL